MSDEILFKTIKEKLFTAVLGDVLDALGYRQQFLPQEIKPLDPETKIVGRAMTVLEAPYPEGGKAGLLSDVPFGVMFEALDDLQTGEIYLASGAGLDFALWGGLMSTRAKHLNSAGAIVNGFIRDVGQIRGLDFPVFSRGSYAQDQGVRGKVVDWRIPIQIGQVKVNSGDLVFADEEGVLIVPQEIEEKAVQLALVKVSTENKVATALEAGMSSKEAFDTFGVM